MDSLDALKEYLLMCESCPKENKLIEFEELPEKQKVIFGFYKKHDHFLLYCQKCQTYNILGAK